MPKVISIDPDGDLTLVVGIDKQRLRVSSKVLAQTPVFRAMLLGSFREGLDIPNKEVPLPEDDGYAMKFLLCILHTNFKFLPHPQDVSMNELLNIAILCDKYDLFSIIGHFYENFVLRSYKRNGNRKSPSWLFIAWVFGDEDIFKRAVDVLMRNIQYDKPPTDSSQKPTLPQQDFKVDDLPPEVLRTCYQVPELTSGLRSCNFVSPYASVGNALIDIWFTFLTDTILSVRTVRIQMILDRISLLHKELLADAKEGPQFRCHARLYGEAIVFLHKNGITPDVTRPSEFKDSLYTFVFNIKENPFTECYAQFPGRSRECCDENVTAIRCPKCKSTEWQCPSCDKFSKAKWRELTKSIIPDASTIMTDAMKAHLKSQAAKWDLPKWLYKRRFVF